MRMPDMCESAGLCVETVFLRWGQGIKAGAVQPFEHLLHPWPALFKESFYLGNSPVTLFQTEFQIMLPFNYRNKQKEE